MTDGVNNEPSFVAHISLMRNDLPTKKENEGVSMVINSAPAFA